MSIDLPLQDTIVAALEAYEPERYWVLWQIPEGRYAYMIGAVGDGWLIVLDSENSGLSYLLQDARTNGRDATQYRLDELTLPDAFDAVRSQPVPFTSSFGTRVQRLMGVVIVSGAGSELQIPL